MVRSECRMLCKALANYTLSHTQRTAHKLSDSIPEPCTPFYLRPPETLSKLAFLKPDSCESWRGDIWSFGCFVCHSPFNLMRKYLIPYQIFEIMLRCNLFPTWGGEDTLIDAVIQRIGPLPLDQQTASSSISDVGIEGKQCNIQSK